MSFLSDEFVSKRLRVCEHRDALERFAGDSGERAGEKKNNKKIPLPLAVIVIIIIIVSRKISAILTARPYIYIRTYIQQLGSNPSHKRSLAKYQGERAAAAVGITLAGTVKNLLARFYVLYIHVYIRTNAHNNNNNVIRSVRLCILYTTTVRAERVMYIHI